MFKDLSAFRYKYYMSNYKILFHFESEVFSVIEIKRFLPNETDKSRIYFWLLFDKQETTLRKLNFVSMSSEAETEFRVFENERLIFDKQEGVLVLNNEEFYLNTVSADAGLNPGFQQAIVEFLR
jgi:hypothetical protein